MRHFCLLPFILLALALCGCSKEKIPLASDDPQPSTQEFQSIFPEDRHLRVTAIPQDGLGFTVIPPGELNNNLQEDLVYLDLAEVKIEIDGTFYPLEEAISENLTSSEEIFAFARLDSRNGMCNETFHSENGLTLFTYHYPEFDLEITYDVYETPDGRSHLINEIGFYQDGSNVSHVYTDDETGLPIDREDWGLTFIPEDVTATGAALLCHQEGGQQLGQLYIDWYYLSNSDGVVHSEQSKYDEHSPVIQISMNEESSLSLDWSEKYGPLPAGEYCLTLNITDVYDESQVHPFMRDFYDRQSYRINLTIP